MSRFVKIDVEESCTVSHRYNYREDGDADDGDKENVVSPTYHSGDDNLSDVKVVERSNPKRHRIRVGKSRGRESATLASSSNRTYVIPTNKHQSQITVTPTISTKSTSVRPSNKQQSRILFISTSKESIKHTMSSTIRRKRQITTHGDDRFDKCGGGFYGGDSAS